MIAALRGGMERFHLAGAAIKAANVADERAGQERRHIDALKLIVESTDGAVNVHKEWLYGGRCAGNRGFQLQQTLPEGPTFLLLLFAGRSRSHRRNSFGVSAVPNCARGHSRLLPGERSRVPKVGVPVPCVGLRDAASNEIRVDQRGA